MKLARIRADLLQVGTPVPFDIYTSAGRLLLRRGHPVETELQLERLLQVGLYDPDYAQAHAARAIGRSDRVVAEFSRLPSQQVRNRVSILETLVSAAQALDDLRSLEPPAAQFEPAAVSGAAV